MAKQKKILVVLTNIKQYGNDSEKTGLWLAEATEFVEEVTKAGYEVDYVSPRGGKVPLDPRSMKRFYTKSSDIAILNSEDFQERALNASQKATSINADDYVAIYYTGGHGVVWDFPDNKDLQALSLSIYENGGFVASVCHGLAGLLNIQDGSGNYLISDKKITGFTNAEEVLSGKSQKVPFSTETEARKRGAIFQKKLPFTSHAVRDGRLITGQNPMSGRAVAKLLLASLSEVG